MPRIITDTNRIELRVPADAKTTIARAAAIKHLDLTGFILGTVLPEAEAVIAQAERIALSERDSLMVLDLLENPPEPNERLKRAIKASQQT